MSDDQSWQVPSGVGPPSPTAPLPPPGWSPPPRPGLIPLRPLDLGTLLGASFRVIRRNPRPTFGVALVVQLFATMIPLIVGALITGSALIGLDSAIGPEGQIDSLSTDENAVLAGVFGLGVITVLVSAILSVVGNAWLQGILVLEVARGALGEKLTLRQLWARGRGRYWALIGWSLILAGVMVVSLGLFVAIIAVLVATLGPLGVGLGVVFGVLGGFAMLVLAVWIGVKLSLVPSAVVLERLPLGQAVRRSWTLTNQAFWRTFGIQLLVWAILSIASGVVTAPFSIFAPLMLTLLDPNGTGSGVALGAAIAVYGVQLLVTLVVGAIAAVIQTASTALIYLDLRMRKEGLDLTLVGHVEARQAGATELPDPYLPVGPAAQA